jgi:hypothetical protein
MLAEPAKLCAHNYDFWTVRRPRWKTIISLTTLYHSSGGSSKASRRGGPGSHPGQTMSDLRWKKWHWDRFYSESFDFVLSVSFHSYSFFTPISSRWSRVSSVSIVSDYGLDDRAVGVWSPAGAEDFSCSLCVHTGSGAHPASCTMGTGGPFPGGKARPRRDADHSPPSSAEVVNE